MSMISGGVELIFLRGGVNTHVIRGINTTVRKIFCQFPCFVRLALPSATLGLTS